ncbi:hypothetical protein PYV61_26495, partial [Roseisolibacter sp. H3M3-2]
PAAGALVVAALGWTAARPAAPPPRAARFDIPALGALPFGSEPRLADDGGALVYVALTPEGRRAVFVRPLDSLRARPVPGTDGAVNVQPSPDGRWLAFNTLDDELRRVPTAGGTPQALGRGFRYARVAWRDDALLTEAYGRPGDGLVLLPAAGGAPRAVTRLARGESRHLAPVAAPSAGLV